MYMWYVRINKKKKKIGQNGKENETAKDQTFIYTNYIHKPSRHKGTTLLQYSLALPLDLILFLFL